MCLFFVVCHRFQKYNFYGSSVCMRQALGKTVILQYFCNYAGGDHKNQYFPNNYYQE